MVTVPLVRQDLAYHGNETIFLSRVSFDLSDFTGCIYVESKAMKAHIPFYAISGFLIRTPLDLKIRQNLMFFFGNMTSISSWKEHINK